MIDWADKKDPALACKIMKQKPHRMTPTKERIAAGLYQELKCLVQKRFSPGFD